MPSRPSLGSDFHGNVCVNYVGNMEYTVLSMELMQLLRYPLTSPRLNRISSFQISINGATFLEVVQSCMSERNYSLLFIVFPLDMGTSVQQCRLFRLRSPSILRDRG